MSYERAYMATLKDKYFTDTLDHLKDYNDRHGERLFSEKLRDSTIRVTLEEEENDQNNINNVTTDTSFQSPVAMNV